MLRILHDTNYDFIRWWKVMAVATVAFILLGLGSLAYKAPNYSIEFSKLQILLATPCRVPATHTQTNANDKCRNQNCGEHLYECAHQQVQRRFWFHTGARSRPNENKMSDGTKRILATFSADTSRVTVRSIAWLCAVRLELALLGKVVAVAA